jgi:hypothetical protein
MKKILLSFLFIGTLVMAKAQTADEIITKHIEALGGKAKLLTLQTLVREGALNYNGMDIPLTLTSEQSKGFRMDINVMGTKGYQINTMDAGWRYMPFQGSTSVEEMNADQVKEGQDDLDIQGELVDYAAKGHKVELMGKEKNDGAETYKLKLTDKNGLVKQFYIDATTYYINKASRISKVDGQEKVMDVSYSNYKKTAEGFIIAHTVARPEGEVNFEKVTANTKLADDMFKPAK